MGETVIMGVFEDETGYKIVINKSDKEDLMLGLAQVIDQIAEVTDTTVQSVLSEVGKYLTLIDDAGPRQN